MTALPADLRQAVRVLARRPGFALLAVLSMALGIGANAAIFGLLDAAVLHPLPGVRAPEELAAFAGDSFAWPAFRDFRERARSFSGLAAFTERILTLGAEAGEARTPERVAVGVVSGDFFPVLGVGPALGRTLLPADEQPGAPLVAVASHPFWRRALGADPEAVGRTVSLQGRSFTLVGVAPAGFRGVELRGAPDLWITVPGWAATFSGRWAGFDVESRNWSWLRIVGRLRPGVPLAAADRDADAVARWQEETWPQGTPDGFAVTLAPAAAAAAGLERGRDLARFSGLLMAVVGLALLIACANVANLLLARVGERSREMGVRLALGAGRGRIVRQLLTESVLLAGAGGAAGVLGAVWALDLLARFELPGGIPIAALGLGLTPRVLAFAAAVSVLSGTLFGLAPALHSARPDPVAALKEQTATTPPGRARMRALLVAGQVTLCLLLLVGAGLFLRGLRAALARDLGFRPDGVALLAVDLGLHGYDRDRGRDFVRAAVQRLEALPGVEAASWTVLAPLSGGRMEETLEIEGRERLPDEIRAVEINGGGPGYFRVLGLPLVAGREPTREEEAGGAPAAVVNETMARLYWPQGSPLGARIRIMDTTFTVVGVARDARYHGIAEEPRPYVYLSALEGAVLFPLQLVARTTGRPEALLAAMDREVRALDPTLPIFDQRTFGDQLAALLMPQRMGSALLGLFGLLTLTLAAAGVYGVVACAVGERRREIGIRMALGARARDVLRLILGRGLAPVAAGLAAGLLGAAAAARLVAGFLYGVSAADPLAFLTAPLLLAGAALLAGWLPASRAARLDPVEALRHD